MHTRFMTLIVLQTNLFSQSPKGYLSGVASPSRCVTSYGLKIPPSTGQLSMGLNAEFSREICNEDITVVV